MSSSDRDQEAIEVADEKSISHFEYAPAVLDAASRNAPPHLAKLWRKLDLLVLPIISIIYFLFSLVRMCLCVSVSPDADNAYVQDRYSIGNARVAGMQNALHITDEQVSLSIKIYLVFHAD